MLNEDQMTRLMRLRSEITTTIGFYHLLDDNKAPDPLKAMIYEVWFKAGSMRITTEVFAVINEVLHAMRDDP